MFSSLLFDHSQTYVTAHPESFDSNGGVVSLPDGLVHVAVLAATQLLLHHNVSPATRVTIE
jgi:hypothetical protein